jgi:hypothetical protein
MAKDGKRKKVKSRASTKYTTSSDEASSSDDEDSLLTLFANLNMQQKEKLNELIGAIHEKDELLGSVWLRSQVEQNCSIPVLLLFGYNVTRTEWLQLENILLRSGTIPLQKINGTEPLCS